MDVEFLRIELDRLHMASRNRTIRIGLAPSSASSDAPPTREVIRSSRCCSRRWRWLATVHDALPTAAMATSSARCGPRCSSRRQRCRPLPRAAVDDARGAALNSGGDGDLLPEMWSMMLVPTAVMSTSSLSSDRRYLGVNGRHFLDLVMGDDGGCLIARLLKPWTLGKGFLGVSIHGG